MERIPNNRTERTPIFAREDHRERGVRRKVVSRHRHWLSQNAGLVAGLSGRSRVRSPVGAVGEFSFPGLTFCADSCSGIRSRFTFRFFIHQVLQQGMCLESGVTALAHNRLQSFCRSAGDKLQAKHAYTILPAKSEWADRAVQIEFGKVTL